MIDLLSGLRFDDADEGIARLRARAEEAGSLRWEEVERVAHLMRDPLAFSERAHRELGEYVAKGQDEHERTLAQLERDRSRMK